MIPPNQAQIAAQNEKEHRARMEKVIAEILGGILAHKGGNRYDMVGDVNLALEYADAVIKGLDQAGEK